MLRRGSLRLAQAVQRSAASHQCSSAASGLPAHLQGVAAAQQCGTSLLSPLARPFSSGSFWDVGGAAQARQELFVELSTIRQLMPERNFNLNPHFTPHGVQLMPHASDLQRPTDPLAADADEEEGGMLADSVKRKRRLKMKKHKYKKRMKKERHQL